MGRARDTGDRQSGEYISRIDIQELKSLNKLFLSPTELMTKEEAEEET